MSSARRAGANHVSRSARTRPWTGPHRVSAPVRLTVTAVLGAVNLYLLLLVGRAIGADGQQPLVFAVVLLAASAQVTWVTLRLIWGPAPARVGTASD